MSALVCSRVCDVCLSMFPVRARKRRCSKRCDLAHQSFVARDRRYRRGAWQPRISPIIECEACGASIPPQAKAGGPIKRHCSRKCKLRSDDLRRQARKQASRWCACGAKVENVFGVKKCPTCIVESRRLNRRRRLLREHGFDWTDPLGAFEIMLDGQGRTCGNPACGATEPGGRGEWHVHHDHACCSGPFSCGKCIIGLFCSDCNTGSGHFGDDPKKMEGMAAVQRRAQRARQLRLLA